MPTEEGMEIIPGLITIPFKLQPIEVRNQMLQRGRPKCLISVNKKDGGKSISQSFNISWYEIYPWLCGSAQFNKLFCWPCLLMRPESSSWCSTGVDDMKKIMSLAAKHTTCKSHLKAIAEYDGTLIEIGLSPEFTKETSAECKSEQIGSDSDSDHLGRYLAPKRPNQGAAEEARERTSGNGPVRQTLTFHAWQQATRARSDSADPKLSRRRRRLARIEINNAELMSQKLRLEIQLLEAKLELQRALNASVSKEEAEAGGGV